MKPATFLPLSIFLAFILAPVISLAQPFWTSDSWHWDNLDDLNQIRAYFPAVATENGKIYAFGGGTGLSTSTNKIEEYDIAADEWTESPYTLPQAMCTMAAAELNGAIYIIGGGIAYVGPGISTVYRFFPETGFDPDTLAPLFSPRGFLSACGTPDGKIYAIGGVDDAGVILDSVDVYDPAANKWTPAPPLNIARATHTSVVVGNKIYVMGGTQDFSTGINSIEVLDLDNPSAGWVIDNEHPLLNARALHGSAVVFDTVIITLGGIESTTSNEMSVEGFEPMDENDNWEFICDLLIDRRAFGCVSYDNSIYIMGGNSGPSGTLTTHKLDFTVAVREATSNPLENSAALLPNTPNPFDQGTELHFIVKKPADIRISIFDATGQWISTPVNGRYGTGEYTIPFEAADLQSGIYFCVMNSENASPTVQKWVVMRK